MKYLYVIGNGFDVFSGLRTRYVDFRFWLEHNYPFIYENLSATYEMSGEWWNDFEQQIGNLDVKKFVSKFDPCKNSSGSIYEQVKKRKELEKESNIPPSFYYDSPCARRLSGLLDVLQYCFEKWIDGIVWSIIDPIYTHIERDNSFFINFNYTDTLRMLYGIPDGRVLHIHGCATRHEHLVFGHNKSPYADIKDGQDASKVCEELHKYHKNPYEYIFKHDELPVLIKDVEKVFVYGFSFSPVDLDYMTWILSKTPESSQWEISWYTENDKKRIDNFVFLNWSLKNRYKLVQLEKMEK